MSELDYEELEGYKMALEQIEARRQLQLFQAMDYSNMKSDARQKMWKKIHKIAYPNYKPKTIRMDDIDSVLKGL